jgi:hypothetical protein
MWHSQSFRLQHWHFCHVTQTVYSTAPSWYQLVKTHHHNGEVGRTPSLWYKSIYTVLVFCRARTPASNPQSNSRHSHLFFLLFNCLRSSKPRFFFSHSSLTRKRNTKSSLLKHLWRSRQNKTGKKSEFKTRKDNIYQSIRRHVRGEWLFFNAVVETLASLNGNKLENVLSAQHLFCLDYLENRDNCAEFQV